MGFSDQLGLGVLIGVIDKTTAPLRKIGKMYDRTRGKIDKLTDAVKRQGRAMGKALKSAWSGMSGAQMMMGSAALAAPLIATGKAAADFEDRMGSIKSLLVTTLGSEQVSGAMKNIQKTIIAAGTKSRIPLSDLADSYYQLQSAIGDVNQTQAALAPTAALAVVGLGSIKESVGTMTMLLGTYGEQWGNTLTPVEKANKIANIAAGTIAAFNTSLPPLSQALQYAGGAAKTAGVPLAELFTILGAAQTAGLKGTLAGTGYNAFLRQLTKAVEAQKSGKKILEGIDLTDATDKVLPFYEILGQLEQRFGITADKAKEIAARGLEGAEAFRAMGIEQKFSAELLEAFGEEGSRIILSLLGQSEALRDQTKAVEESDNLTKMLAARQETLIARLQMTKNSIHGLAIAIGESLLPAQKKAGEDDWLERLKKKIEAATEWAKRDENKIKVQVGGWAMGGLATLLAAGGIIKMASWALSPFKAIAIYIPKLVIALGRLFPIVMTLALIAAVLENIYRIITLGEVRPRDRSKELAARHQERMAEMRAGMTPEDIEKAKDAVMGWAGRQADNLSVMRDFVAGWAGQVNDALSVMTMPIPKQIPNYWDLAIPDWGAGASSSDSTVTHDNRSYNNITINPPKGTSSEAIAREVVRLTKQAELLGTHGRN